MGLAYDEDDPVMTRWGGRRARQYRDAQMGTAASELLVIAMGR